jgi:hypothetical protein
MGLASVGSRRVRIRRGDLNEFIGVRRSSGPKPNTARIEALEDRVAELERRVDDLTAD